MNENRKEENYGSIVKKRRLDAANKLQLSKAYSKSKCRKLVKLEEKKMKKKSGDFEYTCKKAYQELLRCNRKSDNKAEYVETLLNIIFSNTSPVFLASKEMENSGNVDIYIKELSRQYISRSLQSCLKYGNSRQRIKIFEHIYPVIGNLITTSAGHHLCIKLFLYFKVNKDIINKLNNKLLERPKSFFTKYGHKVFDFSCSLANTSKTIRLFIFELFFKKLIESEIIDYNKYSIEENLSKCSDILKETIRKRMVEFIDMLVLKECVNSVITAKFLYILIKSNILDIQSYSKCAESLFEAAIPMLALRTNVYVLCYLQNYWTTKQKKQFLTELKTTMALNKCTYNDYIKNDVDFIFIGKLLINNDDTKIVYKEIIKPLFNDPSFIDDKNANRVLIAIFNYKNMTRYLSSYECEHLNETYTNCKKTLEQRISELATYFLKCIEELENKSEACIELQNYCKAIASADKIDIDT